MPKGLRLVNPKFNLSAMNEQRKVFGDFEIILRYEDCEDSLPQCKYYYIICWDRSFSVKMQIEMGCIDKTESISMEDAVSKVKEYFRCRLNHNDYWEYFSRP